MTPSGDEDDEFYSIDRSGSNELSSVRLEIRLKFDSFTTLRKRDAE